jgi:hypothetical protein
MISPIFFLRGRRKKRKQGWRGSDGRLKEEDLQVVIEGLDPQTRRRLRQLAGGLGLDEVSTILWLSKKTSGPLNGKRR